MAALIARDLLGAAVLGVLSHLLYFIHGTHHGRQSARIGLFYLLAGLLLLLRSILTYGLLSGSWRTFLLSTSYITALFSSMTAYRLFFHRTRHFPGPLAAKVTKLYAAYLNHHGMMQD